MFRLFKAELRKIFLKPSIFVVTGLIILLLALSTFMYNPQTKSTFDINYDQCNTVSEVYTKFMGNDAYSKNQNQLLLSKAESYIEYYQENGDNLALIQASYQTVYNSCKAYQAAWSVYKNETTNNGDVDTAKTGLDNARKKFFVDFENFYDLYKEIINNEKTTVLVTDDINVKMKSLYSSFEEANYTHLTNSLDYPSSNEAYLKKLFPSTDSAYFLDTLNSYVGKLAEFRVDTEILEDLKAYIVVAKERLGNDGSNSEEMTGVYKQIYDKYNTYKTSATSNGNSANVKEMINLVTDYNMVADSANYIVTNSIKVNGLQKLGATNIQRYAPFKSSSLYQMQESLTRRVFLFDNNQYDYQYADVFSISQPSNEHINGFDYSYFALRLCTLFIIVYIVVLAAGTIAGEQSAGTMKLLAIRPFNRNKLLTGKLLAILAIGAILLVVCSIATLVIGGISYGFASAPVLMIFNATSASVVSPIVLYLLAILTMLVEIAFYALLSTFISTVFKSNIGAVTVSILLFFASLVLNIVAVNAPWLRFFPFTNINLFKYFGASFVSTGSTSNVLQGILTPTVLVGASFWLSFAFTIVSFAILGVVSYVKFHKQDIK